MPALEDNSDLESSQDEEEMEEFSDVGDEESLAMSVEGTVDLEESVSVGKEIEIVSGGSLSPTTSAFFSAKSTKTGRKRKSKDSAGGHTSVPALRSGSCSGDGIVVAGREQVFSRVAVTRKAAAQAERERARRISQLTSVDSASMTSIAESVMKRHREEVSWIFRLFS
jgi:hypothetical protein